MVSGHPRSGATTYGVSYGGNGNSSEKNTPREIFKTAPNGTADQAATTARTAWPSNSLFSFTSSVTK